MNKKIAIIITILISIILTFNLPIYSNATTIESVFSGAQSFLEDGDKSMAGSPSQDKLAQISNTVSNILLTIAVAVTFISIAVMGVSFAIQTVEDKAKIKEAMIPWMIGVLVSFGAYGIWRITISILYGMNL